MEIENRPNPQYLVDALARIDSRRLCAEVDITVKPIEDFRDTEENKKHPGLAEPKGA